ncbi:MAG TPA: inorganic phosphate transporter [Tepidisphaeraceae bacterium]|nr:inorganic phosphate transporter [Tepidisphaeraceae bacterium]
MHLAADVPVVGLDILLLFALGLALGFEFVNGFHDTANAVATVIYTHTLRPWVAVIWSGCWNLIGVLTSSGAVAFSVIALLPADLVVNIGSSTGFAMVFALLISAIIWNLGTWYLGLPASSSHTLVGAIMGVGLANSLMQGGHSVGEGLNWPKVAEVFMSLLVTPVVGFVCSALLLLLAKAFVHRPSLFRTPPKNVPPPRSIRGLLILTCTGVSFAHGSNDGQKGMGLILLILVGILPGTYALNLNTSAAEFHNLQSSASNLAAEFDSHAADHSISAGQAAATLSDYLKSPGVSDATAFSALASADRQLAQDLSGKDSFGDFHKDQLDSVRGRIYLLNDVLGKLLSQKKFTDPGQVSAIASFRQELTAATQYIPTWVKFAVALALGLGTMIGWKRIVVTVGERIGKQHLTYAQGAAAELVAMATIGAADLFGMPVSTTHVLSSGVAGTMAANHSGLQFRTIRNIALAWVLTLPACVLLGAATFSFAFYLIFTSPLKKVLLIVLFAGIVGTLGWRWRAYRFTRPPGKITEPVGSSSEI